MNSSGHRLWILLLRKAEAKGEVKREKVIIA